MTTMQTFNTELQEADELLANYTPLAGEIGLAGTLAILDRLGLAGTAAGLRSAAEDVGYAFDAEATVAVKGGGK